MTEKISGKSVNWPKPDSEKKQQITRSYKMIKLFATKINALVLAIFNLCGKQKFKKVSTQADFLNWNLRGKLCNFMCTHAQ